jgi:hypothetical protein
VQVTQQQAVPYQFASATYALNSSTPITWPDQYEGVLTYLCFALTAVEQTTVSIEDLSGDVLIAHTIDPSSTPNVFSFTTLAECVLPSGSGLQVVINGPAAKVTLSGWLLSPPGSTILSE